MISELVYITTTLIYRMYSSVYHRFCEYMSVYIFCFTKQKQRIKKDSMVLKTVDFRIR